MWPAGRRGESEFSSAQLPAECSAAEQHCESRGRAHRDTRTRAAAYQTNYILQTNMHTYKHTYIHTYIHIHTYIKDSMYVLFVHTVRSVSRMRLRLRLRAARPLPSKPSYTTQHTTRHDTTHTHTHTHVTCHCTALALHCHRHAIRRQSAALSAYCSHFEYHNIMQRALVSTQRKTLVPTLHESRVHYAGSAIFRTHTHRF